MLWFCSWGLKPYQYIFMALCRGWGSAAGAWWQQGTRLNQGLIPTIAVRSDLSPGSPPSVWL